MSETQELIVIPQESALEVFTTSGKIEPYLDTIKAAVTGIVPDLTTKKGRDAVASLAFKVTKSKTYLEGVGKGLADEQKEIPKKIDATRKKAREFLEALAAEVRQPLTDWEAEQAAKAAKQQAIIDEIVDYYNSVPVDACADIIRGRLVLLVNHPLPDEIGDRREEAEAKRQYGIELLQAALTKRERYEAEQAELARLRAEKEERDRRDREDQIRREAEENARRQAEAQAQAERQAAEQRIRDAEEAAQRQQQEAQRQQEEAARQIREAEERAEQAQRDADARAEQAAEQERQRIADEQRQEEEAARAREADREHRKAINTAALNAFVEGGIDAEVAKQVITLIAQRKVPAVSITY